MKKTTQPAIFKWRQTEPELILCAVRWYLRYSLSFRDVEELLNERGLEADRTTIWRWVTRTRHAARRTIQGYEAMHMIRKGQARWMSGSDVRQQIKFINKLFEVGA